MCDGGFTEEKGLKKVIGGLLGEYMYFFCEKCGNRVKIKFLGHELATPKFESVCSCGETYKFRAIISDIPIGKKLETEKKYDGSKTQGDGKARP